MKSVLAPLIAGVTCLIAFSAAAAPPTSAYRPGDPQKLSLYGVSVGDDLVRIRRLDPSRWQPKISAQYGYSLIRDEPGEPTVLLASHGPGPAGAAPVPVTEIVVYCQLAATGDCDPARWARMLDMVWGNGFHFDGKPHDRLWLDWDRRAQARLTVFPRANPGQLQLDVLPFQSPVPEGDPRDWVKSEPARPNHVPPRF